MSPPPPGDGEGPTPPPISDSETSRLTDKDGFVISFGSGCDSAAQGTAADSDGYRHIDPREDLAVAVQAAAETLQSLILQAVILGIIVAILTVAGVDRAWSRGYFARLGGPLDQLNA